jgi:hypothetical protein
LDKDGGIINKDYVAQKALLGEVDAGGLSKTEFFARCELMVADRQQPAVLAR